MIHKSTILFILLSMGIVSSALAQESQTVYNFLRLPESSHAAALGGDNISIIEDDATLALSNPALLTSVSSRTVTLGYMNYMSGVGMYTAGYTHVINDKATVGGTIHYLNYGKLKEYNEYDQEMGTFNPSDITFEGILAYTLTKRLAGGVGAKFIYSKMGYYKSTAAAIDLGLNYYDPNLDLSVSFAMKNLGGQLSAYNEDFESLPFEILLGGSYHIKNSPVRVSLTFCDLNHWDYAFLRHACIGVDLRLIPQFYIAAGYNARRAYTMKTTDLNSNSESSHGAGWNFGAGLMLDRFKLNFSYGKYHVNSSSLMFNLAFNF
jgi:long-subunit fatty acid transport protein